MSEYVLQMKNMTKRFAGVTALNNVNLNIKKGTIHSLMGENGAGKSTLMKCLFGIYQENSGEIFLEGKQVKFKNSDQALKHGIAMVHQELNQAVTRNVMDNVWLGRYPRKGIIVDENKMYNDTKEIFKSLGIDIDPRIELRKLSVSQRQMVEIARAVSYNSKIIVFDDPTSSLTEKEVEHLFEIILRLKKDGCAIIYISHKMEEIFEISDEITILRDGLNVESGVVSNFNMDKIIKLMVGRDLTHRFPEKTNKPKETLLKVENLTGFFLDSVKDITFNLKKGEILGVAGLIGSGRTELLELLYGIRTYGSGNVEINGKKISIKTPKESIKNGFYMLTEERRVNGIFNVLSVRDNIIMSNLKSYLKNGIYKEEYTKKDVKWVIDKMRVKTASEKTRIMNLSGGNQQKIILGRAVLTNPSVLMLDEPTRGIDVGAKFDIYQLMNDLAVEGKGIIMVSSEMPELLGVCDRILVMSNNRLAGIVDAKKTTQEELLILSAKYL